MEDGTCVLIIILLDDEALLPTLPFLLRPPLDPGRSGPCLRDVFAGAIGDDTDAPVDTLLIGEREGRGKSPPRIEFLAASWALKSPFLYRSIEAALSGSYRSPSASNNRLEPELKLSPLTRAAVALAGTGVRKESGLESDLGRLGQYFWVRCAKESTETDFRNGWGGKNEDIDNSEIWSTSDVGFTSGEEFLRIMGAVEVEKESLRCEVVGDWEWSEGLWRTDMVGGEGWEENRAVPI